jgi:hypothetical protein
VAFSVEAVHVFLKHCPYFLKEQSLILKFSQCRRLGQHSHHALIVLGAERSWPNLYFQNKGSLDSWTWFVKSMNGLINEKLMASLHFWWSSGWDWPMGLSDVSSIPWPGNVNLSILQWRIRDSLSVVSRLWLLIKILSATPYIDLPSHYNLMVSGDPGIMPHGYPRTNLWYSKDRFIAFFHSLHWCKHVWLNLWIAIFKAQLARFTRIRLLCQKDPTIVCHADKTTLQSAQAFA